MMDNIDEVTDTRLRALNEIEKDKLRVARAYNKKVKGKSFPSWSHSLEDNITSWDENQ